MFWIQHANDLAGPPGIPLIEVAAFKDAQSHPEIFALERLGNRSDTCDFREKQYEAEGVSKQQVDEYRKLIRGRLNEKGIFLDDVIDCFVNYGHTFTSNKSL